jgi:hypothetical protein
VNIEDRNAMFRDICTEILTDLAELVSLGTFLTMVALVAKAAGA